MSKSAKIKEWIKEHKSDIATYSVVGAVAALYATTVVYAIKEYNEQVAEWSQAVDRRNNWIASEAEKGNSVITLENGTTLIVPSDQVKVII